MAQEGGCGGWALVTRRHSNRSEVTLRRDQRQFVTHLRLKTCGYQPAVPERHNGPMPSSLTEFIQKHTDEVKPLSKETALAYWNFETTGSEAAMKECEEKETLYRGIFARSNEYEYLKSAHATDPIEARILTLLTNKYRAGQMSPQAIEGIVKLETEIQNVYGNFRSEYRGEKTSDNTLDDILRNSSDKTDRKDAWEARKQIGPLVANSVRELARRRNAEAKRLGFADFYHQAMELQEIDVPELFALLGDLDKATAPHFATMKAEYDKQLAGKCGLGPEEASMPWNYPDPYFQSAPRSSLDMDVYFADKNIEEVTQRFFDRTGMPIEDLLKIADLYEREGKSQHAFCTDIDREGDVRVLCNLRPNARWMGTMLHEYGHAVYDKFNDPSLHWLLRSPSHILTTEAIAIFMGGLATNEAWLKEYVGVPADEASAVAKAAKAEDRMHKLIFTRWVLVMTGFERAMYEDPERDLNSLWWDLAQKFQGVRKPEGRNMPDWATKLHVALAPAYYHNYLLGELFACQLRHHILTSVLDGGDMRDLVTTQRLGEFLREGLFAMGERYDWKETIKRVTGEPLNTKYFVDDVKE